MVGQSQNPVLVDSHSKILVFFLDSSVEIYKQNKQLILSFKKEEKKKENEKESRLREMDQSPSKVGLQIFRIVTMEIPVQLASVQM